MNDYQAAIGELTRGYEFFLDHFKVEDVVKKVKPIITISPAGRRKALGWFGSNFWQDKENNTFHEINISAEYMTRPVEEIFETLLHEMAHMHNHALGIDDCTVTQYHKKSFKSRAEFYGLVVAKMRGKGYAHTILGDGGTKAIQALKPNAAIFKILRVPMNKGATKDSPYITINLKKEDYEDKFDELKGKWELDSNGEVGRRIFEEMDWVKLIG